MRQGSKHMIPKLDKDITLLMDSLDEHDVYMLQEGRVLDDNEKPVPDILSAGMAALTHGSSISPLAEFNQQFAILRERRRLTPIADLLPLLEQTALPGTADSDSDAPVTISSDGTGNAPADGLDDSDSNEEPSEDEELDALFLASPTLTRFDAADVSLDMDVEEMDLDGPTMTMGARATIMRMITMIWTSSTALMSIYPIFGAKNMFLLFDRQLKVIQLPRGDDTD